MPRRPERTDAHGKSRRECEAPPSAGCGGKHLERREQWKSKRNACMPGIPRKTASRRPCPSVRARRSNTSPPSRSASCSTLRKPGSSIPSRQSHRGRVEQKIAMLEGGVGALCTASGQAATTFSILTLAAAGDHIVSSSAIYGGSLNLFAVTLKRLGIEVAFVSPEAPKTRFRPRSAPTPRRCSARPSPTRALKCWISKSSPASPIGTACR